MKLSSAIEAFIASVRMRSVATATAYHSDLRRLAAKAQVDTVLRFTPELIRLELETASTAGAKMSTLHRKRACFNSFGRWGVRNKLWPTNPVDQIDSIRRPKHVPRPFSDEEAVHIAALKLPEDQALIRALFSLTGLRVTPVCHLKVGDISFSPPQIRAWVKGAKTQVVPMHPALEPLLRAYIATHTDQRPQTFLFRNRTGGPMHRRSVERMTGQWGQAAGVVDCTPHRFRHRFATQLLSRVHDLRLVQEAMGHEDIKSTVIYTEVTNSRLAAAVSSLPVDGGYTTSKPPGYVSSENTSEKRPVTW